MNAGRCEYVAASIVESWNELIYLYGSVIWYQRRKQAVFFRTRPPYVLRGWKGIPWVLVKQPENTTERLSRKEFETLLLCDGETNLDDIAKCYAQLAVNNFNNASSNFVLPFEGYDELSFLAKKANESDNGRNIKAGKTKIFSVKFS